MRKIKDKMLLGVIAGLGANTIKNIIGMGAIRLGLAELDGPHRAAGMLVPPHKLADPKGKFVGYLADAVIGGTLGVVTLSGLKIFGKKHAALKGGLAGAGMWTMLYGILGTVGATKVNPISPSTVLTEFATHTVYGAMAATLISKLGDQSVFEEDSQNASQKPELSMVSPNMNAAK